MLILKKVLELNWVALEKRLVLRVEYAYFSRNDAVKPTYTYVYLR